MRISPFFSCIVTLLVSSLVFAEDAENNNVQWSDAAVWGAMVRGTNAELLPAERKIEAELSERLAKAFDYSHFELVGEHTQLVYREYESWLLPSREMYLRIDSKGPVDGGMSLHLQLWRDTNILVKTDVVLRYDSPLFITGPKWGPDQLFFILELRQKAADGS
ncbi:MAG: hypothetical protein AAF585_02975 [Verrucomicrobiota bacterium]